MKPKDYEPLPGLFQSEWEQIMFALDHPENKRFSEIVKYKLQCRINILREQGVWV